MQKILLTLLTLSAFLLARNDVPSCYNTLKITNPNATMEKELFILIDQTTPLDKNMMIYTYKNMMKFIKNGYGITIASFSANANGKYTDITYSGKLEHLLPKSEKHNIAKKTLRKYQSCMNSQYKYAKKKATKALINVLKGANKKLPHSDIIKSLDDIASHTIATSRASKKVILLVSDMIEHSSITSFYHQGAIKDIDTEKEMQKVQKSGHLTDFSGADIYVIGTGIIAKKGYRDAKTLKRLADFWKQYFLKTHGNLKALGTPMLLEDLD